ncbi:hypothetical protein [Flavobacterium album]|nr:hypothetical protein [Flavobacterium album]
METKHYKINIYCVRQLADINQFLMKKSILGFLKLRGIELYDTNEGRWAARSEYGSLEIDHSKLFDTEDSSVELFINSSYFENPYTPSVYLLEDFFKLNFREFYYIETLTDEEILHVADSGRELNPVDIINLLQHHEDVTVAEHVVLHKPAPSEQEMFIYIGYKRDFKGINDFWLSSRPALMSFRMMANLNYFKEITDHYYDSSQLGACIPAKNKYNGYCDFLKTLDPALTNDNLAECYEMLRDTCAVFDFENEYILMDVLM